MIYYLPERIYEVLKNDDDIINNLLELEESFDKYNSFKDYIQGYSKLSTDPSMKELYLKTNNLIRNKLHGMKFLELQFDINNGDVSIKDMEKLYFFGNESNGVDLENKFFLLSNIMNKTEDHDEYEKYMKEYVSLYESFNHDSLSKYIHLKYMYAKLYCRAMEMNNINDFDTSWSNVFVDFSHVIYTDTLSKTKDKDITANYYLEAFTTAIKRVNYNRELLGLTDTKWLQDVVTYVLLGLRNEEGSDIDFQYELFSLGYLSFLDEVATLYCLNGENALFNNMLAMIVDYINRALSDNHKLLRGLSFYDKVNHNMFISIIRKYLKVLAGIKTNLKINGLSSEDKEYALSDNLGEISAATPNMIQEKRTVESVDRTAEAMINKYLDIK